MADLTITASSVIPGAGALIVYDYTAGAEITAGMPVYLDSATPPQWQKLDADLATGTEVTRTIGVAVNHAYAGQYLAVDVRDSDLTLGATLVTGTPYFASTTPGGICPFADLAAGDYVVNLGTAKSTTKFNLNPSASGAAL